MDDVTVNKYIKCINYLISKKTQEVPHYNKNLFQHLINVYDKLRKWKCNEDICYAGLFHSIYGNESFTQKIETDRSIIKNLIGSKAESLVYQYNNDRNQNKNTRIISLANKLDHDMILIFDDYIDKQEIDTNYFYFRDLVSWKFIGSGKDNNKWRKFNYKLRFKNKIEKKLKKQTESILKDMHIFDLLKPERTYASANPYGTVHESHVDYYDDLNSKGGVTVMYYLNNFWNFNFAGETVFYDNNNQDILKSILPKPGRIIVFNGSIEHCAREVRRDVNDLRMVLTFKYNICV
tara:strand:- start:551 stop:1426 length:876 start_codon:yes stop_codon:yes gene_type:complete